MNIRKIPVSVLAALTVATMGGVVSCGQTAPGETRTETHSFAYAGKALTIETGESALRVEVGAAGTVEVERTLTGKAGDSGNATWALDGDTLRLSVTCTGLVINCDGSHAVRVPEGVALVINSAGSTVRVVGVATDVTATTKDDGTLLIDEPAGKLRLTSEGGDIAVMGARSADVNTNTSEEGNIEVDFAVAPSRLEAKTSGGSIKLTLPRGPETYRLLLTADNIAGSGSGNGNGNGNGSGSGSGLTSDPASSRTITAVAKDGTVEVKKAT